MAAPLVAGIIALLKEKFTDISGKELKALLMNRGKTLTDPDGNVYSVVRQGAGIVQANDAIGANFLAWPGSFSLGHQNLIRKKSIRKKLLLRNLGKRTQLLKIQGETLFASIHYRKSTNRLFESRRI